MFILKKVGTDTEVFLERDGKIVSAIGLVGGTKWEPRAIDAEGSAVQEDNVMLEFNTIPAENMDDWVANINKVMAHIYQEMRDKGYGIRILSSAEFDEEAIKNPQAQQIGCEPDMNGWTHMQNRPFNAQQLGKLRTSGGHLHISFGIDGEAPTYVSKINLIRMLDFHLGLPSVLLDTDDKRRQFYGQAGAFRDKAEDRIEYRTLSNFWIASDELKEWVFRGIRNVFSEMNTRPVLFRDEFIFDNDFGQVIQQTINTADRSQAAALVKQYNIAMPE